jgi:hypothetical protein
MSKLPFRPKRLETAEHLSKLTGQTTIIKRYDKILGRAGDEQNCDLGNYFA